jgi:hypothetical protein
MFVRAGKFDLQRHALSVGDDVVLAAGFPAIRRVWAGFLPATHRTHTAAIDRGAGPVDPVGGIQFRQ